MERAMWRKALDPAGVEAYVRAHEEPWPELLDHLRRSGITNYSIFLDGTEAVGYFEHADLAQLDAFDGQAHPVAEAWRDAMRPLSANKVAPDMGLRRLRRQVFYLE